MTLADSGAERITAGRHYFPCTTSGYWFLCRLLYDKPMLHYDVSDASSLAGQGDSLEVLSDNQCSIIYRERVYPLL
jgi:hypothetical protein